MLNRLLFDSDERKMQRRMALGLGIIILFFMSMFQSCSELKHSLWGLETIGEIATAEPSVHEKRSLYISFFMQDSAGERIRVKRTVPAKLGPMVPGQQVDVIYIAGQADAVRLVAERSWFWPIVFFAMCGLAAAWIGYEWWQVARM